MDVIVLAGDKKKSLKLYGDNKCFLLVKGKPLVIHVLSNLIPIDEVKNIFIVGPKKRLDTELEKYKDQLSLGNKSIFTIEQKDTILRNGMEAYYQSLPEYRDGSLHIEEIRDKYKDKAVLFLPVDIPIFMPEEIQYFIKQCEVDKYDYFTGITTEKAMNVYAPTKTDSGITMAYLHFKEDLYRVGNIHLIKPFKIKLKYLNRMYNIRYQKKLSNVFGFIRYILDAPNMGEVIGYYIKMQLAMFFALRNFTTLSNMMRRSVPISNVEKALSTIIGAKFKSIVIPFGGLALDVDNENDFKILDEMYDKWKVKQREFYEQTINSRN